jgi:hypothetical protein
VALAGATIVTLLVTLVTVLLTLLLLRLLLLRPSLRSPWFLFESIRMPTSTTGGARVTTAGAVPNGAGTTRP